MIVDTAPIPGVTPGVATVSVLVVVGTVGVTSEVGTLSVALEPDDSLRLDRGFSNGGVVPSLPCKLALCPSGFRV